MSPLDRWLWEHYRLRLTWRGEIVRDALLLVVIVAGTYLAWVLLNAFTEI